jgi:hypothetical protein
MGLRAIVRDILGIYVGYEIVRAFIFKDFNFGNTALLIAAIILLAFGAWFLLERIGILPKLT